MRRVFASTAARAMFSPLGLFRGLPCPQRADCTRSQCAFSHDAHLRPPAPVHIPTMPVHTPALAQPIAGPSQPPARNIWTAAEKRPGSVPPAAAPPPTKMARVGPARNSAAVATATATPTGVPVLRVNAATSKVPLIVRQAMVKTIYEHFEQLYAQLRASAPHLAAEHTLREEADVYARSTKLTYRNAAVNALVQIKKRPPPTGVGHPSVGTSAEIAARAAAVDELAALTLTREHLAPLVLSPPDLERWGYIIDVPPGPGGDCPSEEGKTRDCERCGEKFEVRGIERAQQCTFHWGRSRTVKVNDGKDRIYTCCYNSHGSEGCSTGVHVFYESNIEALHSRHAFTPTRPPTPNMAGSPRKGTALELCCLDCEMIYTTGGMSLARVSVVDGAGTEVYDEFVRLDEGVEVIDFNTRFSGIRVEDYAKATKRLADVRNDLDVLINAETIIIGHALDNDMKALRMLHAKCVDTVALFPHRAGPPFRLKLSQLVKEHLGQVIQAGGADVGHSSVEDSVATLDLVRFYVLNLNKAKGTGEVTQKT